MNETADDFSILRHEFDAEEGSFLLQLRCEHSWDRLAFSRLAQAMLEACRACDGATMLERWMADGFWYVPTFTRSWSTHPSFPRQHPADYYEKAYERLDDLAFWFFQGQSPYLKGHVFEPV